MKRTLDQLRAHIVVLEKERTRIDFELHTEKQALADEEHKAKKARVDVPCVVVADDDSEDSPTIKCRACSSECVQRVSKTPKNPGRTFWGCTSKGCTAWNGWLDERSPPVKPVSVPKPATGHQCVRCHKVLNLDHETKNHVRRFGAIGMVASKEIRKELKEAFETEEYSCERCLGNEDLL